MSKTTHLNPADFRSLARLAVDATTGVVDLVEAMHRTILQTPSPLGDAVSGSTGGITGLVYRSVRGVTTLVGGGLDAVLAQLTPLLGERPPSSQRQAVQAALNGVLGDYLAASANPLAITMQLRHDGQALELDKQALAAALPRASGRLLVLVHGLCMNDLQWLRQGHDHGAMLARELGFCSVYLNYNSGLQVASNGRGFAHLLESLTTHWPVPLQELVIIGHSMGGLVARSACHHAQEQGLSWLPRLHRLVFLGTPHRGAPLERGGHWIDAILGVSPYSAPFVRLGKLRSVGITDLRHGTVIAGEPARRGHPRRGRSHQEAPALPRGVECFAIAATTGKRSGDLSDRLLGDGLVPVASALGKDSDPALNLRIPVRRQWIVAGANHMDLLSDPRVYARLKRWLAHNTADETT